MAVIAAQVQSKKYVKTPDQWSSSLRRWRRHEDQDLRHLRFEMGGRAKGKVVPATPKESSSATLAGALLSLSGATPQALRAPRSPGQQEVKVYDIRLLLPSTQTPCSLNILAGICAIPPMWTTGTRSSFRDRARWGSVWLCGRVRTQLTLVMRLMQRLMEVEIELR